MEIIGELRIIKCLRMWAYQHPYDVLHNLSLYTRKKYIIRSMLKKHAKKLLADVYKRDFKP